MILVITTESALFVIFVVAYFSTSEKAHFSTLSTTTWAGAMHQGVYILRDPTNLAIGFPCSIGLLLILGAQELGHYFAARRHRIQVTPPYFVPAPFALGHFVPFTGIVTFENASEVQADAKSVPIERIMVETDAPYSAPALDRNKRCEPAFVRESVAFIANLRGTRC
jgi:TatD related DNase